MGYLGATLKPVFTFARAERAYHSEMPTLKAGLRSAGDITHRKRAEDFGRFWKSQWVEMKLALGEDGWFSLARGDLCGGCNTCCGGGKWKRQNRMIVLHSLYVEEPLNSKVIKSFVPEQRSRQVFFVFQDSYVLSLWTFDVRFIRSHIMAMIHMYEVVLIQQLYYHFLFLAFWRVLLLVSIFDLLPTRVMLQQLREVEISMREFFTMMDKNWYQRRIRQLAER